jgi:hypothetical protein
MAGSSAKPLGRVVDAALGQQGIVDVDQGDVVVVDDPVDPAEHLHSQASPR